MNKKHYIIPIFVPHEGCPHNCVFCNQNSITGEQSRLHAKVDKAFVRTVVDEYISTMERENSIIEISFYGGTFTAIDINKQRELLQVAKEYKDRGDIDFIHLSTRPDYINKEILDNLKSYSVDIIELGLQSLDEEVLRLSGRGHGAIDAIEATSLIKQYGFTVGHQIMLGLPGDDFSKDIETTKKVIEMKPDIARIYPALVIKDTPMEIMYAKGIYKPYTLEEAVNISKIVYGMLTANDIKVIRIGLQPTEEINVGADIIAGPFHPAFRELVEGSLISDIIYESLFEQPGDTFEIFVNPKDVSKVYSNKKQFFNSMLKQIYPKKIVLKQLETIEKGELYIEIAGKLKKMSINKIVKDKYKEGNCMYL